MPADWSRLGFTSGRRTYRGNRLVGGVKDSEHLYGTAADFTAPLSVLQARFPGKRILDEGDHRHVSGLSDVPYHGKRGTIGLVNGIDTTAPKGGTMLQPRKPAPQRRMGLLSDPPQQPILAGLQNPMDTAQLMPLGATNLEPKKPGLLGNGGKGWAALGILGDMLSAYGGQRGVFAPMLLDQRNQEAEDNRFRERLSAEREDRIARYQQQAAEPPAAVKTAMYWDELRKSDPARFGALMSTMDSVNPNYEQMTDADGYVREARKDRVETQEIDGQIYYNINGKWYAAGGQ